MHLLINLCHGCLKDGLPAIEIKSNNSEYQCTTSEEFFNILYEVYPFLTANQKYPIQFCSECKCVLLCVKRMLNQLDHRVRNKHCLSLLMKDDSCSICLESSDWLQETCFEPQIPAIHNEKFILILQRIFPKHEFELKSTFTICKGCSNCIVSVYRLNNMLKSSITLFEKYYSTLANGYDPDKLKVSQLTVKLFRDSGFNFEQVSIKQEDVHFVVNIKIEKEEDSENDNTNKFKCSYCEKEYSHRCSLTQHLKLHTGQNLLKCTYCEKTFVANWQLKDHVLKHTGQRPFKCTHCSKAFTRDRIRKRHEALHECSTASVRCQYCRKAFLSEGKELDEHIRIHTGEKPFKCSQCDRAFSRITERNRHEKLHSIKPIRCDHCEKTFVSIRDRKKHIMKLHFVKMPDKVYVCEYCSETFAYQKLLEKHLRVHTDKPYKCKLCDKRFSLKKSLKAHVLWHEGIKQYRCKYCPKSFIYWSLRRHHMDRFHLFNKTYKCDLCKASFVTSDERKLHDAVHTNDGKYKCEFCDKIFVYKFRLKKHLRVHSK